MGAQRLRDRLRGAARAVGPAGRPAPAELRLPAGRGRLHGGVGGVRRGHQRGHAGRLPAGAGGRGGPADAHVAQPGPGDLPAGAAAAGPSGPGPRRAAWPPRSGRSSAACSSRPAGAGCSWSTSRSGRRAGGGLAPAARTSPATRCPGRTRWAPFWSPPVSARSRSGSSKAATWGWGSAGDRRRAGRVGGAARPVRRCTACGTTTRWSTRRCSGRAASRARRSCSLLFSDGVRRDAAVDRAVAAGRLGLVGAANRAGVAPGPLMVPLFSFLVAGRLIARFGAAVVVAAGSARPGRRRGLVGAGHRAARRLRRRGPRRHAADRGRRRADAAHAHGDGRGRRCRRTSFATGSAVVNMIRQVGMAIGVAVLVAVLGSPDDVCRSPGRVPARLVGDRRPGPGQRRPRPSHRPPTGLTGCRLATHLVWRPCAASSDTSGNAARYRS